MTARLIARPRLVQLLNVRWQRRVVLVVAGPGYGKSIALADAVAENALAPCGTDVLVECTRDDRAAGGLVRHVAAAAGIEIPRSLSGEPVEWLLGELARQWPLGACVLLDDAHLADQATVRKLVSDAPSTLHFVLASRSRVPGLARLRAAGEVVEIGEDQLRLQASETAALAQLHGVEPVVLDAVGGWPAAAAMAAAYGIDGAEEYLFETVIEQLGADCRRLLTIALAVGGGDAELLAEAAGDSSLEPASALIGLPLVRLSDRGEFVVHDLWRGALGDAISDADLAAAIRRAVVMLADRSEFDRAFRLCAERDDWSTAAQVIRACCRRGHAEVSPDVAEAWLSSLPRERWDEADGLLLRGLVARIHDPFGAATVDVLERAVAAARQRGDIGGEVAAGVELVYVLRNQGRTRDVATFIGRALELDGLGHPEAAGPAAVGRALIAELEGDDAAMVAQLELVPAESLSRDWQIVATFRMAMGHLVLGNESQMVAAANRCADLAGTGNDRYMATLAAWFAGDPDPTLATFDDVVAAGRQSGVDAVMLGSMATMVAASTGRLDCATRLLASIDAAAAGPLSVLLDGAVVGVRALVSSASGDDDTARSILREALSDSPLDTGTGWRRAARWLPLAYVLVPSTRCHLDSREIGDVHRRRLDVARAIVWAVEECTPPPPFATALTSSTLCTSVPLPWAMALASRLAAEGSSAGARIAGELMDRFGEPAKDALRAATEHGTKRVACGAKCLLATIAAPPEARAIVLSVLGPTLLDTGTCVPNAHWNRDRVRSLMTFLALRRSASREEIVDAVWSHLDPAAAERNMRVTLCYLQQVLEPERRGGEAPFFLRQDGPTLTLAPAPFVRVDAEEFDELVLRADDADERGLHSQALELLEAALAMWRGPCLSDVAYEDWAQVVCRELSARFVRAATRAGQLHLGAGRPDRAERCADRALRIDAWSESAYQLKVAAALQHGDRGAAARDLAACDAMLAELGVAADERTEVLRQRLRDPAPCGPRVHHATARSMGRKRRQATISTR